MSVQRGNHWKRRVFRHVIGLGTVPSLLAGALYAAPPSLPGLPGLPGLEQSNLVTTERPQLLPVPTSTPGDSLRTATSLSAPNAGGQGSDSRLGEPSGVNIKILPALPPSGLPTSVGATVRNGLPAATESSFSKATVVVKMQDAADAGVSNAQGIVRPAAALPASMHSPTAAPITIANEKARVAGPVKLSIGDDGIVDHGVQRPRQETVVPSRAPELVKQKRYSVSSQPVVLAQAADLQAIEPDSGATMSLPNFVAASTNGPEPTVAKTSVATVALETDRGQLTNDLPKVANLQETDTLPGKSPEHGVVSTNNAEFQAPTLVSPGQKGGAPSSVSSGIANLVPPAPANSARMNQAHESTLRQFAQRTKPEKAYEIESRGTYSIDVPFAIAYLTTLDQDICTVFNNGKSITLAGGTAGNTRVAVASATGEARVIEVNVLPVGQQFSRPQNDIDQVKELIGKVFPDARIQIISLPTGEVEVKGTTTSESDARKILELVRKVCLVPVHDRLRSGR